MRFMTSKPKRLRLAVRAEHVPLSSGPVAPPVTAGPLGREARQPSL
jgi:hypothetical protein